MLGALLSFLIVYAIYVFIDWLRHKKPFKPTIAPHKRIARSIWIYCVFLVAVAIVMVSMTEFNRDKFYRPMYGQYKGWYFPNGYFSDLRIGDIRDKSEIYDKWTIVHEAILMNRTWEELPKEDSISPYKNIVSSLHSYNTGSNTKSFVGGILLRVYDLSEEVNAHNGKEELAYDDIIKSQVTDSSFYQISKNFLPLKAIETSTYGTFSVGEDTPPIFKKHITIFANERAYELNFYVDTPVEKPSGTNTFDLLDAEFIKTAKNLDLHSYNEWNEEQSTYLSNLNIKCGIFIILYLLCILGAVVFAVRYYRNIGNINPRSGKTAKILSIADIATFIILGLSLMAAFCSIHHEQITEIYQYRFSAYINDEYAATSILCYGAYFLLLIIPTNRFYIKSYSQPKPKTPGNSSNHTVIYWLVRPFAIISRFFIKNTKAIRDEYNKQISDKSE